MLFIDDKGSPEDFNEGDDDDNDDDADADEGADDVRKLKNIESSNVKLLPSTLAFIKNMVR